MRKPTLIDRAILNAKQYNSFYRMELTPGHWRLDNPMAYRNSNLINHFLGGCMFNLSDVLEQAMQDANWVIGIRRRLHLHPEL